MAGLEAEGGGELVKFRAGHRRVGKGAMRRYGRGLAPLCPARCAPKNCNGHVGGDGWLEAEGGGAGMAGLEAEGHVSGDGITRAKVLRSKFFVVQRTTQLGVPPTTQLFYSKELRRARERGWQG